MKKLTGEWVRKAENAIAAARQLIKQKPILPDEIGFHCQQAIEKYLKALQFEQGIAIKKTHDLVFLLKELTPADPTLKLLRPGLKEITRYSGEFRYPGLDATSRQARAAYKKALIVRNEIRERLGLPKKRR
jgi:HEPN domain-containing protein